MWQSLSLFKSYYQRLPIVVFVLIREMGRRESFPGDLLPATRRVRLNALQHRSDHHLRSFLGCLTSKDTAHVGHARPDGGISCSDGTCVCFLCFVDRTRCRVLPLLGTHVEKGRPDSRVLLAAVQGPLAFAPNHLNCPLAAPTTGIPPSSTAGGRATRKKKSRGIPLPCSAVGARIQIAVGARSPPNPPRRRRRWHPPS
jgi:hypothetical protein